MNPFAAVFNRLTYRTAWSTPRRVDGLCVRSNWWGKRTVHHPDVPALLEARRRRILCEGLDAIDAVLMDADTLALLRQTADRMATGLQAAAPEVPRWIWLMPCVLPGLEMADQANTDQANARPHSLTRRRSRGALPVS